MISHLTCTYFIKLLPAWLADLFWWFERWEVSGHRAAVWYMCVYICMFVDKWMCVHLCMHICRDQTMTCIDLHWTRFSCLANQSTARSCGLVPGDLALCLMTLWPVLTSIALGSARVWPPPPLNHYYKKRPRVKSYLVGGTDKYSIYIEFKNILTSGILSSVQLNTEANRCLFLMVYLRINQRYPSKKKIYVRISFNLKRLFSHI